MDILKFGEWKLRGSAAASRATVDGQSVPALELRLEGPVTGEALEAMTAHELVICGEDGGELGRHSGYDTLVRHTVVLAKPDAGQKALAEAQRALLEAEREKAALERENAALLFANLTGEEMEA